MTANVRSFGKNRSNDNLDFLHANVQYLSEYRDANLLCFTETWWCEETPTEYTQLEGFGYPYRRDRDTNVNKKQHGGGVCVYVNERWCRKESVIVREEVSNESLEALTLSLRPDYLPRDFGQIFITVVYVPSWSKIDSLNTIRKIFDKYQKKAPSAPHFILGDFNHFDLKKEIPTLEQYVTTPTRQDKIIDKCYGNIREAYRSVQKSPIGFSDHFATNLLPKYVKKLKREPIQTKVVKIWNEEALDKMKTCLETTDWDVLTASENVSETADVLSSYISFCESTSVHLKTVRIFPNNKPWMDQELKKKIDKNKLFAEGKKTEGKMANKDIKNHIKQNGLKNKEKTEQTVLDRGPKKCLQ